MFARLKLTSKRPERQRPLGQSGDTIVEVLIAIAVVTTVLTGAYLATSRNVASTQDAQERDQAVQLVQSQIEQLRTTALGTHDCFYNGTAVVATGGGCEVNAAGQQAASNGTLCSSSNTALGTANAVAGLPHYKLCISLSGQIYTIKASWANLYGSESNVTMFYGL